MTKGPAQAQVTGKTPFHWAAAEPGEDSEAKKSSPTCRLLTEFCC